MSRSTNRRTWAIGATAAGAMLLAVLPIGGAQAADAPVAPATANLSSSLVAHARVETGRAAAFRAAAAPATVPSVCTVKSYAPNRAIVGNVPVTATFSVKVTGCTLDYWVVGIGAFMNDALTTGIADTVTPTISLSPKGLLNAYAGNGPAGAIAYGTEDPADADPAELDTTFKLLRASSFGTSVHATPAAIKKGKLITLTGTLTRVNWDGKKMPFTGYANQSIVVQFRPSGSSAYTTVKTVTAGKGGKISTTVKASATGYWRLGFVGNSTTGNVSSKGRAVTVS